ncbi:MAG TPA: EthD family reductase [Solirubrobacteraceae bacterium]|jgi:uncharacterized protein (TIGR02118 family)
MFKVVWVVRFRDGFASADARHYWRAVHAPLGAKVPGVERFVQSHVVSALGPVATSDDAAVFDGYTCCWYADRGAFEASLRALEWTAVGNDSPNLFDDSCWDGWSASLDPRTIVDGDLAPFKTVWFVRFKPDVRVDAQRSYEAFEYWTERHGKYFGARVPGIERYVQNHVVSAIDGTGENGSARVDFDGFSECWFSDREAFERAMASPEWLRMNEDAQELFDIDYSVPRMSAVLEENVVVAGAARSLP